MIGAWYHSRSATITSVPSMSGRPRSKMIASGGWLAATASASRPVPAVRTSYCRARRLIRSARTSSGSSSTMRMSAPPGPGREGSGRGAEVLDAIAPSAGGLRRQLVQRDVQLEHVDRRLTEEAEHPALGVLVHQRLDLGHRQIPGLGHAVDLDGRVLR